MNQDHVESIEEYEPGSCREYWRSMKQDHVESIGGV